MCWGVFQRCVETTLDCRLLYLISGSCTFVVWFREWSEQTTWRKRRFWTFKQHTQMVQKREKTWKTKIIMLPTFTHKSIANSWSSCLIITHARFNFCWITLMSESHEKNGGLHTETFDKNKVTTSHSFRLLSCIGRYFYCCPGNCKIAFNWTPPTNTFPRWSIKSITHNIHGTGHILPTFTIKNSTIHVGKYTREAWIRHGFFHAINWVKSKFQGNRADHTPFTANLASSQKNH